MAFDDFDDNLSIPENMVATDPTDRSRKQKVNRKQGAGTSVLDGETGSDMFVAPNGSLNTGELIRLVGGNFVAGQPLLTHMWTTTTVNGGSTSTTNGELTLSTNTTANGEVRVQTANRARFITATFNIAHLAVSTPNYTNTNVIRRWGCFDPNGSGGTDGIYFENNSGTYSIKRVRNGVLQETVAEASFSEVADNPLVKNDNIAVYEIVYNAGTIFFYQNRKLLHRMSSLASAAYGTPHLRAGFMVQNTNSNTTDNTLVTRGIGISRIGAAQAVPNFFRISTSGTFVVKNTPGRFHKVLITDKGVGSATVTIYNNTAGSGTVIALIDTNDVQGNMEFQAEFDIGLTVVVSGSNVGLTVIYD